MKSILYIATEEWRYWSRSHLTVYGTLLFLAIAALSSILNVSRIDAESHQRAHQQNHADQTFLAQPDRHPHRMVHYGHYVFRSPVPLAIFDPGLDSVTGQSIFLEGHRQNTAMFAASSASANFGGLSLFTPAFIYQLFAPLIIILVGHASIVRERESSTITPLLSIGIKGNALILGKTLALTTFCLVILLPLIIGTTAFLWNKESPLCLFTLFAVYFLYLFLWALIALSVSTALRKRATILAALAGAWVLLTLVFPSVAVDLASNAENSKSKIETDLSMLADLRKLGDGHNASDPAFTKMRENLLVQYNVSRIEDLPVNFRGLVALSAEEKLTNVLNNYANARMENELQDNKCLQHFSWLSPTLALAFASRNIAGTDLSHYHQFLKEAEALRFSFVQGLNRAHAEKLSYEDDINRNKDEESWKRARVGSANWEVLDKYKFTPKLFNQRFKNSTSSIIALFTWSTALLIVILVIGRRIKP